MIKVLPCYYCHLLMSYLVERTVGVAHEEAFSFLQLEPAGFPREVFDDDTIIMTTDSVGGHANERFCPGLIEARLQKKAAKNIL